VSLRCQYFGQPYGESIRYYWLDVRYPCCLGPLEGPIGVVTSENLDQNNVVLCQWDAVPGATEYYLMQTADPAVPGYGVDCLVRKTGATSYSDDGQQLSKYPDPADSEVVRPAAGKTFEVALTQPLHRPDRRQTDPDNRRQPPAPLEDRERPEHRVSQVGVPVSNLEHPDRPNPLLHDPSKDKPDQLQSQTQDYARDVQKLPPQPGRYVGPGSGVQRETAGDPRDQQMPEVAKHPPTSMVPNPEKPGAPPKPSEPGVTGSGHVYGQGPYDYPGAPPRDPRQQQHPQFQEPQKRQPGRGEPEISEPLDPMQRQEFEKQQAKQSTPFKMPDMGKKPTPPPSPTPKQTPPSKSEPKRQDSEEKKGQEGHKASPTTPNPYAQKSTENKSS
jgi:hypothetical protein